MKTTFKLMSGLLALSLVLGAVVWTMPNGQSAGPTAGTTAPSVRSAGVIDNSAGSRLSQIQPSGEQVYVSEPAVPTISPAVRDLPPLDDSDYPLFDREMARKDDFGFTGPDVQGPPWLDPLAELQDNMPAAGINDFTTPLNNWAGMDYNSFPPDTTGDVGPNHFVQAVNGSGGSTVRVFDKSGTVLATFTMESLASTAPCNDGYCDPIVIYDSLADRWFISEFSSSSGYPMCLYVSATPDPMGTWYAYTFDLYGYDYPKYGLWPDAYYMGYNGGTTGTRQVFAFDRAAMLAGQPATYQMFSVPILDGFGFQLLVPASLEGPTPPPAGAPGLFMRPRDTEVHDDPNNYPSTDLMEIWAFHVDWNTPANSTVTKLPDVPMAEYDSTLCGTGSDWSCMPQPETTQALDPIREPLHQPLQYRNWGTYETLVGGFVNDVDGTDHASVRWFEMRKTDGAWSMYQQGTIGGDPQHRSVTSAALDGAGGLALGYTLTGANIPYYPSIRYAGRRSWDPLNTMAYVDVLAQDGDSSQTSYNRWGDYSGIGVDPADDCTFWYTTEYMSGGSSATRVISFRFDPDFVADPSPTLVDLCGGAADAVYSVSLAKTCAIDGSVTMTTSGLPANATESWSTNPVAPPGSTVLTIGNLDNVALGTYNIDLVGTAAGPLVRQETIVLNLQTAAPAAATLSSPADGEVGIATDLTLSWAVASRVGTYDVEIATDPGFTNIVRSASDLAGTSYTPTPVLDRGTVYYWRVRGNNGCGIGDYSPIWTFSTSPIVCQSYAGNTGQIRNNRLNTYNLTVPSGDTGSITDVDVVDLAGTHASVGYLDFALDSPANTSVVLIPPMCADTANFRKTLDDESSSVLACPLGDGATQQPANSLSSFDSESSIGMWVLSINNAAKSISGALINWTLQICRNPIPNGADYSDLANSYGIAWHNGTSTLRLGPTWTADDGFGVGDDNASDDGVSFPGGFVADQSNTVRVNVQGTATNGQWLRLWFDWNGDGIFGDSVDGEQVYTGAVNSGDNNIPVDVPAGYSQPVNYRARLYDSATAPTGILAQDDGSFGGADGGEVEDGTTPAPTAVTLARFEALPARSAIQLEWETATELDNLGFNLYRSNTPGRGYLRLNEVLIASQAPGSPTGAVYTWTDADVEPGVTYYYELEDVDIHGAATRHGPVEVSLPYLVYLPLVSR